MFQGGYGSINKKIIGEMGCLVELLESVGEARWCNAVRQAVSYLSQSNYRGIEDAKKWFGTYGSLNDLIIHPINGHKVSEQDLDKVNSKLRAMSSNIYNLLQEIERNASNE